MARKLNAEPELVTLPDVTVAFVHTSGDRTSRGHRP
jgi:hypothetical protein